MTSHPATVREREPLLLDGDRRLAWCEAGAADGDIVLYLHGTGSSRLEVALYGVAAARHGLRLVAWDRPGSGGSDPQPGRTVLDVVADARAIAAAVGAHRPVVFGLSGGGTHALALAATAGDTIRAGVAINPGAPSDDATLALLGGQARSVIKIARDRPRVFDLIGRFMERRGGRISEAIKSRSLDPLDLQVINDPAVRPMFEAAAVEGSRQPRAYTREARIIWAAPWGFPLDHFAVPLQVFAGRNDLFAPFSASLAASGAQLHWFDGGHVTGFAAANQNDLFTCISTL